MTRIRLKIPMPRGVCAHVIDRGDHIEIAIIVSSIKDKGHGTEAIKRIQKLGRVIRLEAVPCDGCKKRLYRWYSRLGFIRIPKGRRTYFEWKPNDLHKQP